MTALNPVTVNPYRYGHPIREPEWFFGREEQLQTILDRLSKHESTSLIGERRSGKTSLLYQLLDRDVRRKYRPEADNLVFAYITPELMAQDPRGFFYEVLRSLYEQGLTSTPPTKENATSLQMRDCVTQSSSRKLVILLDEFDAMIELGSFPSDFFGFLRGLAQRYDVSYVTATRENLFQCCPAEVLASPFPNIFTPVSIGSFEPGEFDYFITETGHRSGISLKKYKESILALAGRYPFFVQMACSRCFGFESRKDGVAVAPHQRIQTLFEDDARPHMKVIWKRYLSEEERQTILALSRGLSSNEVVAHNLTLKGYIVDGRIFSSLLEKIAREQSADAIAGVSAIPSLQVLREQGIWVDQDSGDVWVEGKRIEPLTRLEYDLLCLLHKNRGKICDKYRIVEEVWSDRYIDIVGDSRIAKLVDRLREKVEPDPSHPHHIITIHGRGYRLETHPQEPAETT